tara:strand:+ start:12725 stop:12946 length:222 start_codon:yes stop_codon:yes gene_type:complete
MDTFKIGDFVRSDTDDIFIGIIVDKNERQGFEVAWDDGDFTYNEGDHSMFHHEMKPRDWTSYLYEAFSDFFCP